MAKTSESKKQSDNFNDDDFFADVAMPEGGQEIVGDVKGYWDFEKSAIRFKPLSVKMFDGNLDKTKPSILILGVLTAKCPLYTTTEDKEKVFEMHPAGTPVGVWYKAGLRNLRDLCELDVYVKKSGEKDTGKPNPMITFQIVASEGKGSRIPVVEDFRDKSADVSTPFDPPGTKVKSEKKEESEDFDDAF